MTSKQRAYLRSLGNALEPIFQIGKKGLSEELITELDAALEARELIKVRILKSCSADLRELAESVARSLAADLVQTIGNNFLIYREALEGRKIELP